MDNNKLTHPKRVGLEKDIEFILKRIQQQHDYLVELSERYVNKEMNTKRYIEVFDSAKSQLDHFRILRNEYYEQNGRLPKVPKQD